MDSVIAEFTQINLHRCKAASLILARRLASQNLPIALIQEPYAHNNKISHLEDNSFRVFQDTSLIRPRAGVVVAKGLNARLLTEFTHTDQVPVVLELGPRAPAPRIIIASVYLPHDAGDNPVNSSLADLVAFASGHGIPLIIGSDVCDVGSQ